MGHLFNAAASVILAAKEKEYLELLEILSRAAVGSICDVLSLQGTMLKKTVTRIAQQNQSLDPAGKLELERVVKVVVILLQRELDDIPEQVDNSMALIGAAVPLLNEIKEAARSEGDVRLIALIYRYQDGYCSRDISNS